MSAYVILVQQFTRGEAKHMLFGASTLDEAMTLVKAMESMAVNFDTFIAIQDSRNIRNVYESMIPALPSGQTV